MKRILLLLIILSSSLNAQDTLYDCLGTDVTAVSGWLGDGWCDDGNNHAGCSFDGGDCCGDDVKTTYCTVCECLQ